ncbi:MAG: hypothetical protein J6V09_02675 [Clostridia bacterium]|nr:hypothetical protein [Clostridia bacterium]
MDLKKLGKLLLHPHVAIMVLLIPLAAAMLILSMVFLGTESPIAIFSYVISAYTLTVWCFRIPKIVWWCKRFKNENKFARRWLEDARLRVNVSLYSAFLCNALYGIFHLWLGFYHRTFWFYSLGAYYLCLAGVRFYLARHTSKYAPGEKAIAELKKYRACGGMLLVMNLSLSLIIFFMVYFSRTFKHHMITTIAMAAYTFTSLTTAIISVIKYRKYNSPAFSASKAIGLTSASVSMLTLESTMLTTFGGETMTPTAQKWMLGATGGAISLLVVTTAFCMLVIGTRKLKLLKSEDKNG